MKSVPAPDADGAKDSVDGVERVPEQQRADPLAALFGTPSAPEPVTTAPDVSPVLGGFFTPREPAATDRPVDDGLAALFARTSESSVFTERDDTTPGASTSTATAVETADAVAGPAVEAETLAAVDEPLPPSAPAEAAFAPMWAKRYPAESAAAEVPLAQPAETGVESREAQSTEPQIEVKEPVDEIFVPVWELPVDESDTAARPAATLAIEAAEATTAPEPLSQTAAVEAPTFEPFEAPLAEARDDRSLTDWELLLRGEQLEDETTSGVAFPIAVAAAAATETPAKVPNPAKQPKPTKEPKPAKTPKASKATAPAEPVRGEFAPAPRRGLAAWSQRTWWAVAASVVLIAAIVAGTVLVSQNVAANNRVTAAVAGFTDATSGVADAQSRLDTAVAAYDDALVAAQAAADSAGPALASVAGTADPATLDPANAAHADLVATLAAAAPPVLPEEFVTPDFSDASAEDIPAIDAAAEDAEAYMIEVQSAVAAVEAATAEITAKVTALTVAQQALGASLPETAATIVEENDLAEQSFRDAVTAAAAGVGAAQATGASGDAELQAYAGAVTALRADQERAVEEASNTRPPTTPRPLPTPTTDPAPVPDPEPVPDPSVPAPDPSLPPDPAPTP